MDVADLYLARQRRLLGTFPQAIGYRQWRDGAPTPADGEETAHTRRSSEATLLKDVVRILANCNPDLQHSPTSSRAPLLVPNHTDPGTNTIKEGTAEPAAGKSGPTTGVQN